METDWRQEGQNEEESTDDDNPPDGIEEGRIEEEGRLPGEATLRITGGGREGGRLSQEVGGGGGGGGGKGGGGRRRKIRMTSSSYRHRCIFNHCENDHREGESDPDGHTDADHTDYDDSDDEGSSSESSPPPPSYPCSIIRPSANHKQALTPSPKQPTAPQDESHASPRLPAQQEKYCDHSIASCKQSNISHCPPRSSSLRNPSGHSCSPSSQSCGPPGQSCRPNSPPGHICCPHSPPSHICRLNSPSEHSCSPNSPPGQSCSSNSPHSHFHSLFTPPAHSRSPSIPPDQSHSPNSPDQCCSYSCSPISPTCSPSGHCCIPRSSPAQLCSIGSPSGHCCSHSLHSHLYRPSGPLFHCCSLVGFHTTCCGVKYVPFPGYGAPHWPYSHHPTACLRAPPPMPPVQPVPVCPRGVLGTGIGSDGTQRTPEHAGSTPLSSGSSRVPPPSALPSAPPSAPPAARPHVFCRREHVNSLAFLARVDHVSGVMVRQCVSVKELEQYPSPGLYLLMGSHHHHHHHHQECGVRCGLLGKGEVAPELRHYCRRILVTVLGFGRPAGEVAQVQGRVATLEGRAYTDHRDHQMEYCWRLAASLCLILERLGWVPLAL